MRVTDRIIQVGGKWGSGFLAANVFFLLDSKLTVVDTGFKGRALPILKEARLHGYRASDIANVIITHHHADHMGSLAGLEKLTGAKVVAHHSDAPYIDGTQPQPGPSRPAWLGKALSPFHGLWSCAPAEVDIPANDSDELPILGGIKVLHTPGHTPGSISLYLKQERALIVGDLLANRFGLSLPSRMFTVNLAQEIESINRILSLDLEVVCFGHGPPLTHNARESISRLAHKYEGKFVRVSKQ
ncbi:MAG: MBL fold metallo-hydrolase [Chloroflexi bacterium]|nr:MBL fold metallo-hydrolase [Chloroflexota bacterium]